jgi:DNA-binding transcriptional ArsR family regulator
VGTPDIFAALADPTRRLLLERLAGGDRTVTDLAEGFPMSQAAISQHLRLLRDAGLVEVRPDGRHRYYHLRQEAFTEVRTWLDDLQRFWKDRIAALGEYLEEHP